MRAFFILFFLVGCGPTEDERARELLELRQCCECLEEHTAAPVVDSCLIDGEEVWECVATLDRGDTIGVMEQCVYDFCEDVCWFLIPR